MKKRGQLENLSFKNSVERPIYEKEVRLQMIKDIENDKT